jgi:pimeloyl-ACP methyl ester carboxylesterase
MTMLYAASHPDRTSALVLCNTAARFVPAPGYPIGIEPELVDDAVAWTRDTWGEAAIFATVAPSLAGISAQREFHARLGSGIQFEDRGTAELEGLPGEWQLAAVTAA